MAKATLLPEGVRQKGRSRTWLDDHGYWLVVIEFQPSSWSRGSYLNVGCMWLFNPQDYIAFHEGYREKSFIQYRTDEQFLEAASGLAVAALDKIREYRLRFASLASIYSYLVETAQPDDFWSLYFAGVAAGLVGEKKVAVNYFSTIEDRNSEINWQRQIQERATICRNALSEPHAFTALIKSYVNHTRLALKLDPISTFPEE